MDMRRILLTLSTTEETQAPGFSRGAESELLQVRQTFAQSMHQNISVRTVHMRRIFYYASLFTDNKVLTGSLLLGDWEEIQQGER